MTTPALVVAGDKDDSRHFTDVGPDWHADPYRLAPAPKTLLTLFGAEHLLGGISGYDAAETTDEDPGRVAALGRLTSAYLPPSSSLATTPGRRRARRWRPAPTRADASNPSRPPQPIQPWPPGIAITTSDRGLHGCRAATVTLRIDPCQRSIFLEAWE